MQTKLHVNIAQGVIDVEGDEQFVREIYNDFKDHLQNFGVGAKSGAEEETDARRGSASAKKRSTSTKRKATAKKTTSEAKPKASAYKPTLDKNLDTTGLSEFYGQFKPKNNAEKILIFAKFIEDKLVVSPCTGDQIYSCYRALKESVPRHFRQALIDARGREYGYIDYTTPDDITVTLLGQNHFDRGLARAGSE